MEQFEENTFQTNNSYSEKDVHVEVKEASTHDLETSPVSKPDSNNSVTSDLQTPPVLHQEQLKEHSEEIEIIPEEQELSRPNTLHCSPTEKEEDGFNFDKELPATPPCDIKPSEQDLLMNFSTSHFEDVVNVPKPKTPENQEELSPEIIGSATPKTIEVDEALTKEIIPEHNIPENISVENISVENISVENISVESIAEKIILEESIPEESIPEESIPEESISEESIPKKNIPEENISKEPEEISSSTKSAQAILLDSPAVKEEPLTESPKLSAPPESQQSEKISHVEPVGLAEEPKKTRSVKSSKLISVIGGRFDLSQLNSHVIELIYWRDSRKSGIVLGSVLAILLSLSIVSVVSVVSYASLSVLAITLSFRLYKNILQAVQKTSDGHPFKEYLEVDVTLPAEKVQEIADLSAARLNATLLELRRLFLVEDLVDSFKFGLALWALTYVGSWFNGITLVILAVVGVFSLPKVYETHQEKIDQNLEVIRVKVNEVVEKVQAVLPIGKKPKSQ